MTRPLAFLHVALAPCLVAPILAALGLFACSGPERASYHGGQGGMDVQDPPDVHLEGDQITIDDHILFALDSDEILGESSQILDHLAQFLGNHPEITAVHLIGHTDESGDTAHNQDLSERRAAAVRQALLDRGVRQALDSAGRGESVPLCQEDTEECHARNRRVEFRVETSG